MIRAIIIISVYFVLYRVSDYSIVRVYIQMLRPSLMSPIELLLSMRGRADCYHTRPQVADSGTASRYRG